MKRVAFFAFGVACHLMFLAAYAYLVGFLGNWLVPKTIDSGSAGPVIPAALTNLALLALFGVQHSVMARPAFKRQWTRVVPQPLERSVYVLVSNLAVIALLWLWQPMPQVIWQVQNQIGWWFMTGLYVSGVLLVPAVSLMINHFDLFGTRQVWLHLQGREYEPLPFKTPLAYALVRHPLYIGWALAFWATPTMTLGHLLFAIVLTGYMVLASKFEERDLIAHFGAKYEDYRQRVPAFVPSFGLGATNQDRRQPAERA